MIRGLPEPFREAAAAPEFAASVFEEEHPANERTLGTSSRRHRADAHGRPAPRVDSARDGGAVSVVRATEMASGARSPSS
ncbi:MAG: hypothetical protein R3F14_05095 [Polyangiaceae bacterium]